jgi:hypothetical protein
MTPPKRQGGWNRLLFGLGAGLPVVEQGKKSLVKASSIRR